MNDSLGSFFQRIEKTGAGSNALLVDLFEHGGTAFLNNIYEESTIR